MKIKRWKMGLLLAALVVPGAWLLIEPCPKSVVPPAQPATQPPLTPDPAAQAAWDKIQPHLAAAKREADAVVEKHCGRVSAFFAERRKRARAFAEEALSYRSKWEFAKSKLPFTDGDGHRKYLRERFEEIVMSGTELEEVLRSAVRGCVVELQGIDNALLVKIRADLGDDALGAMRCDVRFSTDAALREEYARAIEKAAKVFAADLPVWGGREALTWVGADLTAPIIRSLGVSLIGRLGLSGGILGTGAATGALTLGGGVVAGLVIDALLDRLLRALGYDPEADIEAKIVEALQQCEALVLKGEAFADTARVAQGDSGRPGPEMPAGGAPPAPNKPGAAPGKHGEDEGKGLSYHLQLLCSEREMLRNEAIRNLVLEGGGR